MIKEQPMTFISLVLTVQPFSSKFQLLAISFALIFVMIALPKLGAILLRFQKRINYTKLQEFYQKIFESDREIWQSILLLLMADLILLISELFIPNIDLIHIVEFPIGLSLTLSIGWFGYRVLDRIFQFYVAEITQKGRKLNEDLLILGKGGGVLFFIFIIITLFAQVHQINLLGLLASVGIGGVAIAFAAQKMLEQLLGGIVLYLDPPFLIDDYICLPDGTFGKVESLGLRCTRIRVTGKGTLMVVPNNYLMGINIENFTGASKIINIVKVNFTEQLPDAKKSFVRQLILESNKGTDINSRNITIDFQEILHQKGHLITEGQVKYFVPSANDVSTEFRFKIINIISENIEQKLLENKIKYQIVDRAMIESKVSI